MTTMKESEDLINEDNVRAIIENVEEAVKSWRSLGYFPWVSAIFNGEFPIVDRNEVARRYVEEYGWYAVFHKTSSENGEMPGLTEFKLLTAESYKKWDEAYSKEYKSSGHLKISNK